MRNDWDAVVVGLAAIGSGAAYWLSRRFGDGVLGLEQFGFGHERHDDRDDDWRPGRRSARAERVRELPVLPPPPGAVPA